MTFAREAWPFVVPPAAAAALLAVLGLTVWALAAALAAAALLLFFRIPARRSSPPPAALVAPANGRVTRVDRVRDPELGEGVYHRIVTFLSVFDVHVQRAPTDGEVVASRYRPGRKRAAFRRDAGEVNESLLTVLRRSDGATVGVRQIAGLLARRVVGYCRPGQAVRRGELMGIIKFGSRVDLLVPESWRVLVEPGQRMREGVTEVALPEAGS